MDVIERLTGFDLDGDGTVAGDIVCEVRPRFLSHAGRLAPPSCLSLEVSGDVSLVDNPRTL